MIGTLLFYAIYPLSRYLTSRPAEASKKGLSPAVTDGTAERDGGAVTTPTFTQAHTTLLDHQWLNSNSATMGEAKERMKDPSSETDNDMSPDADKEQLPAVLHEETQNEAAPKMSDAVTEEEEVWMRQEGAVTLKQEEDGERTIHKIHLKPNTEDGRVFSSEDISPEQAHLQTEDGTEQTTLPVEEKIQMPGFERSEIQAEVTECWDEYLVPTADKTQSDFRLASLLSNPQTHLDFSGKQETQTGWHFPAGPGLTEEVQCPLWEFPAVSYYPPFEPAGPFEVMWRLWEEIDESSSEHIPIPFTKPTMDFTVMSYNILAQDLLEVNMDLYTHCPLEVLDWSYRCRLLLEEILKWEPDILCLQEVQENHYHEQLYPVLSQMGYTCVYKRRTGTKTDGCAVCYRSSCFSTLSVSRLEFHRPETGLLDRHNVGIVLLLQPVVTEGSEVKAKGSPLCVANTHLLFNPRRGDVKLAQLAVMLAEIDKVVQTCKDKGEHCNVIMCGDFNSVPCMSLYQLITTGQLYFQGLPAWMISGQEDLSYKAHFPRLFAPLWPSCLGITENCQYITVNETLQSQRQKPGKCQFSHDFLLQLRFCPAACVRPVDLELIPGVTDNTPDASRRNQLDDKRFRHTVSHRLDLESVYKHTLPGSGNPEVTTLHSEMGATVDYIFYTPSRRLSADQKAGGDFMSEGLKLVGSLSLLSEDVLWSMRGLPNHVFPSDHLSLLAKFQLDLNAA